MVRYSGRVAPKIHASAANNTKVAQIRRDMELMAEGEEGGEGLVPSPLVLTRLFIVFLIIG